MGMEKSLEVQFSQKKSSTYPKNSTFDFHFEIKCPRGL